MLAAAQARGMGVLALKAYAKCRLKPADGVVAMDLGGTLGEVVGDDVGGAVGAAEGDSVVLVLLSYSISCEAMRLQVM